MKTLGQIAQEAFDAAPHDHTKTFDKQEWWEAAAQAVRAAVIEECCAAIKATESFGSELDQLEQDIATLRSLK